MSTDPLPTPNFTGADLADRMETLLDAARTNEYDRATLVTASDLADATSSVNTTGKAAGLSVWDSTNHRLMTTEGTAATDPWYSPDGSVTITPISDVPVNTVAPVISGTPTEGETLSVSSFGTWSETINQYVIRWQEERSDVWSYIPDAFSSLFIIPLAQVGATGLRIEMSGVGDSGTSAPVYSNELGPVLAAGDTDPPTLIGVTVTPNSSTTVTVTFTTDENNGNAYWVVTTTPTDPSASNVKQGLNSAGAAGQATGVHGVTASGGQTFQVTTLQASSTYYIHLMQEDEAGNQSTVLSSAAFTTLAPADTTPPTLSSAAGAATGVTTGVGSVTTDEPNGRIYWVASTASNEPTAAQVKAGLMHTGAAARDDGSIAVASAGVKTASASGLAAASTYYFHFMHEDAAGNQSTVASTTSFTTSAATTSPIADYIGDPDMIVARDAHIDGQFATEESSFMGFTDTGGFSVISVASAAALMAAISARTAGSSTIIELDWDGISQTATSATGHARASYVANAAVDWGFDRHNTRILIRPKAGRNPTIEGTANPKSDTSGNGARLILTGMEWIEFRDVSFYHTSVLLNRANGFPSLPIFAFKGCTFTNMTFNEYGCIDCGDLAGMGARTAHIEGNYFDTNAKELHVPANFIRVWDNISVNHRHEDINKFTRFQDQALMENWEVHLWIAGNFVYHDLGTAGNTIHVDWVQMGTTAAEYHARVDGLVEFNIPWVDPRAGQNNQVFWCSDIQTSNFRYRCDWKFHNNITCSMGANGTTLFDPSDDGEKWVHRQLQVRGSGGADAIERRDGVCKIQGSDRGFPLDGTGFFKITECMAWVQDPPADGNNASGFFYPAAQNTHMSPNYADSDPRNQRNIITGNGTWYRRSDGSLSFVPPDDPYSTLGDAAAAKAAILAFTKPIGGWRANNRGPVNPASWPTPGTYHDLTSAGGGGGGSPPPSTPATLTSASTSGVSVTTASGSVTSDQGTGTLYWGVSTSVTEPTTAQLEAGFGVVFNSQPVTSTGAQNISISGLTASTTYYLHFGHKNAGGLWSNIITTVSFTTSAAPSGFVGRGAAFDGTDYFNRSGMTMAAGSQGLMSFWFRNSAATWTTGNGRIFQARISGGVTTQEISFTGSTPSGALRLTLAQDGTGTQTVNTTGFGALNTWYHVMWAWDWAAGRFQVYVNGVQNSLASAYSFAGATQFTQSGVNLTAMGMAAQSTGSGIMTGDLAHLWYSPTTTLDLSVSANRLKFASGGSPVDLGADGSTPTGTAPVVYMDGAADAWANAGTGGAFTKTGTLTASSPVPTY
jgi:hypothetical protein